MAVIEDRRRSPVFLQDDAYLAHVAPESGATQSIRSHLEGTMYLAVKNCPLDILINVVKVTALLHDAGKLGIDFYDYMKDVREYGKAAKRRSVDHVSAGGRIVEKIAGGSLLSKLVSTTIYSHHGLQDCIDMNSGESLSERQRQRKIDMETIEERYFQIVDRKILIEYLKAAHQDVRKLCEKVSDFVRSTGEKKCGSTEFYIGMYGRLLLSLLIDSDWTDTACFSQGEPLPERITEERIQAIWEESIHHFEHYIKHLSDTGETSPLNIYRNEISELCYQASKKERSLYRLTVPTGAGKTFSSLRFALHHAKRYCKRHIIYVAPYNSILEQNAEDIRCAIGNESFVLEHHCNIFYEDEKEEKAYKKLSENWDSPIIATTAVQILNTLFSSKKSSIRRMYNLCNSVIIFDEVQAFPVKGTELFNLAVNFLTVFCNTTVVLCSATQPSLAVLEENNLFDCAEMTGQPIRYREAFKRVAIEDMTQRKPGGMVPEDISHFALKVLREYGTVLIIVNTKLCAKKIYEALKKSCEEECELYHLSTSMCPKNRMDELNAIKNDLKKAKRVICVSTQLIEAGVNLSFGCVIRSLAGIDSIIQAAGRCNRHRERSLGKVYVIKMNQEEERLDRLYDIRRARDASEKFLYYFRKEPESFDGTMDSESAVAAYYKEYFYDSGVKPTKYPSSITGVTLEELLGRNKTGCLQYERRHGEKVKVPYLNQAFRTAGEEYRVIPEEAEVTVVIPYDSFAEEAISMIEKPGAALAEQKRALRKLQRYSVGISAWLKEKLDNALHQTDAGVFILNMDYYDKKVGVLDEPKNRFLEF